MMTLIAGKQQQPRSHAEKTSCITSTVGSSKTDQKGGPYYVEQFLQKKESQKRALVSQLSPATTAIPLLHAMVPSLPLYPVPLEKSWEESDQASGRHSSFDLEDLPKQSFPRDVIQTSKNIWTSLSTPTDVGEPVGLCHSHNKIYGWEVSWILQLVYFWSCILQPPSGTWSLAVSCSLATLACCSTNLDIWWEEMGKRTDWKATFPPVF